FEPAAIWAGVTTRVTVPLDGPAVGLAVGAFGVAVPVGLAVGAFGVMVGLAAAAVGVTVSVVAAAGAARPTSERPKRLPVTKTMQPISTRAGMIRPRATRERLIIGRFLQVSAE